MKAYSDFVNQLDSLLESYKLVTPETWKINATRYVDGLAAEELRRLVALDVRRDFGAFFTNSNLANQILENLGGKLNKHSKIYDPACGAGNLLIAAANLLNQSKLNLKIEGSLFGTDIHKEFVQATRLRLAINQLLHRPDFPQHTSTIAGQIKIQDGLVNNNCYEMATHVIVNPPFNLIESDEEIEWAKGKVSSAALFIDKIVQNIDSGVSVTAILPDVLRNGTRYEKWRSLLTNNCSIGKVKLLGQFDKHADIDIFSISLTKKKRKSNFVQKSKHWVKHTSSKAESVLESKFDVCVGPVVDNRDAKKGASLEYLVSRGLKDWSEIKRIERNRKHQGKSFIGPFVVIKRTSRMGDKHRAAGSIINASSPIYVDNHLLVLKPKSGTITDCRNLLKSLKDVRTSDWLNKQIRCRHLTVRIVSKIPIWQ